MDKTIFVRTSKGEDEMRNKTAYLSVDIKRTLLMVDGVSSIREISKRVPPSLRTSLGEIFKELLREGYIIVKVQAIVTALQPSAQNKTHSPVKMTMPTKISIPILKQEDDGLNELDFASAFDHQVTPTSANEPSNAEVVTEKQVVDEAKFRAEIKARVEAEFGDEIKARVEAELRAEAKAREEAEVKQRMLDEAKAIDEARALAEARARAEAKARAEEEQRAAAKAREKAEEKKRAIEEARLLAEAKAKQEAEEKTRAEAAAKERARLEAIAIAEEKARIEAEIRAEAKARIAAETKKRLEEEARILAEKKAKQEAEAKALAAEKARLEAERARVEAERARVEAEKKAAAEAKARAEAEAKKRMQDEARALSEAQAKQEAEAKALEAAKLRAEAELKAIAEAKLRAETEARAIAEAKARIEAEMRAEAQARIEEEKAAKKELEQVRMQEQLASEKLQKQKDQLAAEVREKLLRSAKDEEVRQKQFQADSLMLQTGANEVAKAVDRTTSATVLFFDVVGYTKLSVNKQIGIKAQFNQLVSDCLAARGDGERLILDTGDGAAIGFMQHPEDALQAAMQFRNTLIANHHNDYPELKVRIGIHMGPVSVVKDMNGQSNMVGDGINDAQRVMNFAGEDQIFVSRAYYEFITRLSDKYVNIFHYQGTQKDKHQREHHIYKLVDISTSAFANEQPGTTGETTVKLEPFSFNVDDEIVKAVSSKAPVKRRDDSISTSIAQQTVVEVAKTVKPLDAAPAHSTDEINELEQEQAKLWADAEQNAIETAQSSKLRIIQPQDEKTVVAKSPARIKREPIPWGKISAGLSLVLLVTLFVAPYVFPMRSFIPKVEQLLIEKLQQPVQVGGLAGRLLPTPRIDLIDVSIGETKPIKVQLIRANFSIFTLFSDKKSIHSLELENIQLDAEALKNAAAWLKNAATDKQYPIAKILLSDSKLEGNGIQLSDVGGEVNFNNAADFSTAQLYANGHKLAVEMNASADDKITVSIAIHAMALPLLPNWMFDDISAKGELTNNTLAISEIDSHISGGILHGNARLDWHSGWSMEGSLTAKGVSAQSINKAVNGDMEGTARFQMHSTDLSQLTNAATMDGSLVMNQGVINGIDIVETATRRSLQNLPGGRTHFDELWSDFSFANGIYNFRQMKVKAGVMTAKGTLDVNKQQQLSGRVTADMALRSDNMGAVPMLIGGSADNPTLVMGK